MDTYRIELSDFDLGQVLDGLEARAHAWEQTAKYHRTGESPADMIVEECRDAEEAENIAAHYQRIIGSIRKQREAQL
jgi:hypothetical protein